MSMNTVRTYIDLHGPITVTHQSGKSLTLIAHPDYLTDYTTKESNAETDISFYDRDHGIVVHKGDHEHEGFYTYSNETRAGINVIRLNETFAYELRHLLPAAIAQVQYYGKIPQKYAEFDLHGTLIDVRVYGLADHTFNQTQRGSIVVCPIAGCGLSDDHHRITGYMFSPHDSTIKHEAIQAWRMRQLTRDELIAFDPRWGDLVK